MAFLFVNYAEALESWRLEKLKDIRSASAQNLSMSDLSNEESSM